jgi:two-component system cell cycle response regulator
MHNRLLSSGVISRLPTPKGVALTLTAACREEDAHLKAIGRIVRTDPTLSGRLLALANAAASGGRAVVSVDDAIHKIGIGTVSQVALAFSLIDQYSDGPCTNFNYAGYWNKSLLMAAASQQFGVRQKLGSASELFTVGLLASVGALAMATAFPQEYSDLIVTDVSSTQLLELEQSKFAIHHLDLSVSLMEHWGIPSHFATPFGMCEVSSTTQFDADAKQKARFQCARSAWLIALALSNEGASVLFEGDQCIKELAWLELSRESILDHLTEIESVWQAWLTLISRH